MRFSPFRRRALAAGLLALGGIAQAQTATPLRHVVPFGPGTTTDIAAFGQQEIRRWAEAVKRSGAQVD